MIFIDTDGITEPSLSSTRMLNIVAANQADVMNLISDAKLKPPSREVFQETHVDEYHRKEEQMRLFLCPGDSTITEWVHQLPTFEGQHALFLTASLEGGYSQKGLVRSLCWHQDTRMQTAHTNIKQRLTRVPTRFLP